EDTLHVLAALNEIGADAGEPVTVSEDPQHRHVVVSGKGLSSQRQQEIAQALQRLPRVTMDFSSGKSGPIPPTQPAASERFSTGIPESIRQQLEDRLGGAAALQEMTDLVLEDSAAMLARAHALQALADKFQPGVEAGFSAADRELLHRLRQRHLEELGRTAGRIRGELKPLLTPSRGSLPPSDIVSAARQVDATLNRL